MELITLFNKYYRKHFELLLFNNFSVKDLYEYGREKIYLDCTPDDKPSFRELNISSNCSMSRIISWVWEDVKRLLYLSPEEKLLFLDVYLNNYPNDRPGDYTPPTVKPTYNFRDISHKMLGVLKEVLQTPVIYEVNQAIVYIPDNIDPKIQELIKRFNSSYQKHLRKIKSLSPVEFAQFISQEVWETWFKDQDPMIVKRAQNIYIDLYNYQNSPDRI